LSEDYQARKIGDKELKETLVLVLHEFLEPIRARRVTFERDNLNTIPKAGTEVARTECQKVVALVRDYMKLTYPN